MRICIVAIMTILQLVGGEIRFIALGNWGDDQPSGHKRERYVANIMNQWCGLKRCDFIMSLGDNFHPSGVTSETDERFISLWKNVYNGNNIKDLKWYISIGDRDHKDNNEIHQLQFGILNRRWEFPYYYYNFEMNDGDTSALFYAVDTESLRSNKHRPNVQLTNLARSLSRTEAVWKLVFGHHPPVSVGRRGGDSVVASQVLPICERNGVDLFLASHDRNLQHIKKEGGIHVIVSGGGANSLYGYSRENEDEVRDQGFRPIYFGEKYGFVGITLSEGRLKAEFFTYRLRRRRIILKRLYEFTKYK